MCHKQPFALTSTRQQAIFRIPQTAPEMSYMSDKSAPMEYVTYTSRTDSRHVRHSTTRREFVERLLLHAVCLDKLSAPGFSPVTYPASVTRRGNDGVASVTALVYDIERKPEPVTAADYEALCQRLHDLNLEHVFYTSHSHTPEAFRLRLVLFVSRPLTPPEFRHVYRITAQRLAIEGIVDPATKDVSRLYFWPTSPPGGQVFSRYRVGQDVDVDDLLADVTVAPFSGPLTRDLPAGYQYVRPSPPVGPIDLTSFRERMRTYRGGSSENKTLSTSLIRKVSRGEDLCSVNYYNTFLRVIGILTRLFPSGTSPEEVMAVLHGSIVATYGKPDAPHAPAEGFEIIGEMVEKDVEKRAAEEAANDAILNALNSTVAETKAALEKHAKAANSEDLAATLQDFRLPAFIFCVPEERYYYPDTRGYFTEKTRVRKDAIINWLLGRGWDLGLVKDTMKHGKHPMVAGTDVAPFQPALFSQEGEILINAWRAPTLKPAPGDWSQVEAILDSLTYNVVETPNGSTIERYDPQAKAWLINWLAWCVQNPGSAAGTAVLFNGLAQGSGKNTFGHIMAEVMGTENSKLLEKKDLESRFNAGWADKLFVFGDEISSKEHDSVGDTLKAMVTGQSRQAESKGVNATTVRNRGKFIFASNHAVPFRLEPQDRRFSVFTRHENATEDWKNHLRHTFFTPANEFLPGALVQISAFAYHLEHLPVDEDAVKTPYRNYSKRVLINASLSADRAFCLYVDENGIDDLVRTTLDNTKGYTLLSPGDEGDSVFGGEWDFGDLGVTISCLHKCYMHFAKDNNYQNTLPSNKFAAAVNGHRPVWAKVRVETVEGRHRYVYRVKRGDKRAGAEVKGYTQQKAEA